MTSKNQLQTNNAALDGYIARVNAAKDVAATLPDADTAGYEVYEGSYLVTPAVSSQTLDTSNKLMQSDVVIEKIPYAEATNNSGGKTATIGGN